MAFAESFNKKIAEKEGNDNEWMKN
jgi:hypothetical protein